MSLFLDGGFGFQTYKVKPAVGKSGDAQNGYYIGIRPGVKVDLASNISFVAHAGFLGYRDADDEHSAWGENGFGFDLNGSSLTFGLFYNF